jgi:hypothetical protein
MADVRTSEEERRNLGCGLIVVYGNVYPKNTAVMKNVYIVFILIIIISNEPSELGMWDWYKVYLKYRYSHFENVDIKSTFTNMAAVWNVKVVCEKFSRNKIF